MARQAGFQLENNLTRGLITEASGLNFPENACTETYDCVFSEKGKVTRRFGFDYEGDHEMDVIDKRDCVFNEFIWNSAGGTQDKTVIVVQVGATLHYYLSNISDSLSSGHLADTTDLTTFQVGVSPDVKGNVCQFATGNGYLFVVHPLCNPFYVSFNGTDTFTETAITIQTRDLEGDKADPNYSNFDTRPTGTINNSHKYNLYNQGWYQKVRLNGGGDEIAFTDWDNSRTDFPSNADIWWVFKNTSDEFDTDNVFKYALGNTPAPKGHYILTEFSTNRTTLSGITATERNSNNKRPSTVTFFTGRVWYSGVDASEYNQKIYYTQIIEGTEQFGKCYQKNDPTSSEQADLLADDGGVVVIPDAGKIIKLFPMSGGLMVFATNGVWSIAGSEGVGFKATDYAVRKISSVEAVSPLSFVDVYGQPFWWNRDGIFTIGQSELPGSENVVSLTDGTIKDFLADIPSSSKLKVKGAFNTRTKIVQWIYRSTDGLTDNDDLFTYDRVLNFNLISKAFYPWTIGKASGGPEVHGIIASRGLFSEVLETDVVDGSGTLVVDSGDQQVVISQLLSQDDTISFRYLVTDNITSSTWNMTWAQCVDTSYLDWHGDSKDLDYSSYFITGYKIHGDAIRFFENNYLNIFMTNEQDASAFIQGIWDFANTPASARYTNAQQVYVGKPQRGVQQTRKKMRGRGRSLQFKFYSESGKPFTIHGWGAWETQDASV